MANIPPGNYQIVNLGLPGCALTVNAPGQPAILAPVMTANPNQVWRVSTNGNHLEVVSIRGPWACTTAFGADIVLVGTQGGPAAWELEQSNEGFIIRSVRTGQVWGGSNAFDGGNVPLSEEDGSPSQHWKFWEA